MHFAQFALLPWLLAGLAAQTPAVPTFNEHVAAIVYRSCTPCHRSGEAAPFALMGYSDVKKRGRKLLEVIEDRYMPPWHPEPGHGSFRGERRLTDEQIATMQAWVKGGMPEGPADKAPTPPTFASGWQLGEPDLVVHTSGAFEVPASGRDIYRNFSIPLELDEDKWIAAIEVRPSERSVLHHVLVFLDENQEARTHEAKDGKPGFNGMRLRRSPMVSTWAVGGTPSRLPDGLAIKLPKGSDLVLQSHLHPTGKKCAEETTLGIYFAKEPPTRTLVAIQLPPLFGALAGIDIPPGEKQYRVRDSFELPCDVDCVRIGGHAHLLCSELDMHAELADGSQTPLLSIKHWDFNWQDSYTYQSMVRVPKGAVLRAELVYDNSKDNPNNPNRPPKRVSWGLQTTDEMGCVTVLVAPADEKDAELLQQAVAKKNGAGAVARVQQAVEDNFKKLDTNRDGKLSKDEVPRRLRNFFERLDTDKDGFLSMEEAKALGSLVGGGIGGR